MYICIKRFTLKNQLTAGPSSSGRGRRGRGQATQLPKALGAARLSAARRHDAHEEGQLPRGGGEGGAQEEIREAVR